MSSPSTITERAAEMNAMRTAGPHNEVTGAFAREQARPTAGAPPAGIAPAGSVPPDGLGR